MDDSPHPESDPFDGDIESLTRKLKEVDPGDAPEIADELADRLSEELDRGDEHRAAAEEPS